MHQHFVYGNIELYNNNKVKEHTKNQLFFKIVWVSPDA